MLQTGIRMYFMFGIDPISIYPIIKWNEMKWNGMNATYAENSSLADVVIMIIGWNSIPSSWKFEYCYLKSHYYWWYIALRSLCPKTFFHTHFFSQFLLLVTNKQNSLKINQFLVFSNFILYTQASRVIYRLFEPIKKINVFT